jgi:hypothetical protein
MIDRNQGLTTTYNQLKDPANQDRDIIALRRLHENLDRAVLVAYDWSDIEVPPFETPTTSEQKAAFERFSDTVIDRLFALNAERAAAEDAAHSDADGTTPDADPDMITASGSRKRPRRGPKRAPGRSPAQRPVKSSRSKRRKTS